MKGVNRLMKFLIAADIVFSAGPTRTVRADSEYPHTDVLPNDPNLFPLFLGFAVFIIAIIIISALILRKIRKAQSLKDNPKKDE
jgi:hypothetical protein